MQEYLDQLYRWYAKSLKKIVLLFIIIVVFTLLLIYLPFANLIFTASVGFFITFISWYILFSPGTKILIIISFSVILLSAILTFVELNFFVESLGILLYLMISFISVNLFREKNDGKKKQVRNLK